MQTRNLNIMKTSTSMRRISLTTPLRSKGWKTNLVRVCGCGSILLQRTRGRLFNPSFNPSDDDESSHVDEAHLIDNSTETGDRKGSSIQAMERSSSGNVQVICDGPKTRYLRNIELFRMSKHDGNLWIWQS